jgi:hypothetical protein
MVGSRRRLLSMDIFHVFPVERIRIEHVQIVEVVTPVSSTENKNVVFVGIYGVHVARAWRLTSKFIL